MRGNIKYAVWTCAKKTPGNIKEFQVSPAERLIAFCAALNSQTEFGRWLLNILGGYAMIFLESETRKGVKVMSEKNNEQTARGINNTTRGLLLGLIYGASFGTILWLTTDNTIYFPIFLGTGLVLGLAVGAARNKQGEEKKSE